MDPICQGNQDEEAMAVEETIVRVSVRSSNLRSLGWGPLADGTLEVEFVHGAVYRYTGVPVETALAVAAGRIDGSVGRTFERLVRTMQYPYERVK